MNKQTNFVRKRNIWIGGPTSSFLNYESTIENLKNKSMKNIPNISYLDMIYDSNYSPNSDLGNSTGIR